MGEGKMALVPAIHRILVMMTVGAAALWGMSCGGGAGTPDARDDGGAGQYGGAAGRDSVIGHDGGGADKAQCPTPGNLTAEPPPRQIALDGPVPLDRFVYALAVARCNYLSRCYALSTYVANNCVDQVTSNKSFAYPPSGATIGYPHPSDALLQASAAGLVSYDAQQASTCIAALLAEGCAGSSLIEQLPACASVFTCASPADGGAGPTDGGSADGGSTCPELVAPYTQPVQTCSTDQDCAGVTKVNQGPDCVAGICAPSRCGLIRIAGCSSFAAAGEPCGSNAFSVLTAGVTPNAMCAPGLGCQGRTAGDGLGTCVVPVDVGGACTDDANCKPGLACACGTCEIPPATGPCANGLCEVGAAYCDRANDTCRPVRHSGADCADASNSCAPGLICDFAFSLCQPPP
jgi:hypothetical protein